MALLIDPPSWPAHGRLWSHLVSDVSFAELHAFARALGVPERGFEGDHYDVPEERYAAAVAAGAVPVASRELLRRLHAAGLRRPKRRGEVVIASLSLPTGGRVDTLVSTRAPRQAPSAVVLLAARPEVGQVLALSEVRPPSRGLWPGAPGAAIAELAAAVLRPVGAGPGDAGAGGAWPGLRQLGYLRFLGPDPDDVRVDVVVHVDGGSHEAVPPAAWVDAAVVAAASPALGPLITLALRPMPGR